MPSEVTVTATGGGLTKTVAATITRAAKITTGDLLLAMALQQSRILERTERGVDVDGRRFAGYNKTRPYYYYPAGAVGKRRLASQLRGAKSRTARAAKGSKGQRTVSGMGIRFASYDAFKRGYLGRTKVDLRGARAPHMLQQILMQAGSETVPAGRSPSSFTRIGLNERAQPAISGRLGIYGEAGARASGHNEGAGHLPQRRFFDMSERDIDKTAAVIADRVAQRIWDAFGK